MSDNKKRLDSLVNQHYTTLLSLSSIVTRRSVNKRELRHNLLHDVLVKMYETVETSNKYLSTEEDFLRYAKGMMNRQFTWARNKKHGRKKDNSLFTYQQSSDECNVSALYQENITDKSHEQLYIDCENVDDMTKLFLKDMLLNDIPVEKGIMVNRILDIGNTLEGVEREIFELYFVQEINCLEIYKELKRTNTEHMSYAKILSIQKDIKRKIIEHLKW